VPPGGEVRDLFVDGVQRVANGSIVGADVDGVVDDAVKRAERILQMRKADWRAAGSSLVKAVDDGRL